MSSTLLSPGKSAATHGKWKLVWSDEFDYTGHPDPSKWGYEVGFVRNHEAQYYVANRLENARVENSMLILEGRKEQIAFPPEPPTGSGDGEDPETRPAIEYTSASLATIGKAQWTFGRIEVRAKLPQGKGVWPAIWMLGTNVQQVHWPRCGEIDIMEFVGHTPTEVHGTLHFSSEGKHKQVGKQLQMDRPFDEFHVYAVDWYPDHMDFSVDGEIFHTFDVSQAEEDGQNPYHKPHYLILNLALGGGWGGEIDDSMLPQKFMIDYVRVYQRES